MSLTEAMDVAGPGDTISLADGLYREPIVTMNAVSMVYVGDLGVYVDTCTDTRPNVIVSSWRTVTLVILAGPTQVEVDTGGSGNFCIGLYLLGAFSRCFLV